ncbi:type II secretion system F family protein [Acidisphaera sp. L21]|jgi:tight adherence protein C|uniref:type II secretion system F family protein n=1 Tax=Acidisphaera sp. L21 TaxID=1641851 RepID=UPI00131AA2FF|nr:type II secretion system F family protein [Acidisphaera sp. L21]
MTPLMMAAGGVSLLCGLGALLLLRAVEAQEKMANRVAQMQLAAGMARSTRPRAAGNGGPFRYIAMIGTALARSGLLSDKTVTELEQTLMAAGFRGGNGLGLFVGSKLLMLVGFPVMAWFGLGYMHFSTVTHNGGTGVAAILGLLAPDYIVKSMRKSFLQKLDRGLPDALDMMVICSEAGLGLEPAITRVAAEIGHAHPAVAEEMRQTASELRIISDRRVALQNMGNRTGLDSLKRLGATLVQTMQYGTPLSQALRTLSSEMRTEALTRFEERAARLPVLLTVPMIVFILPTVFAVVGGPAALKVMASLHGH